MRQWRRRGADVEMLDATAMTAHLGGQGFKGGWIDRRGGSLHPLNYARGLARAALAAGAKIHGHSAVTELKREGGQWRLAVGAHGSMLAEQVIIATNGYTGTLWPGVKATVVPANSFQVATAPLDEDLLARVLPSRVVVSDSRRIGNYFRIGPGGRLMMGGRGCFSEPQSSKAYASIIAALRSFFPEVQSLPVTCHWSGRVAMTRDHLPHVHKPAPALTIALGYNGRGVAMASALGTAIGAHLLDETQPLPMSVTDIRPMPAHGWHPVYASLMIAYYRLRDRLER
jgi:glycine/D-amino acid oxidase-like deaminating enzyme